MKKITTAEGMNLFFISIIGMGFAFLASSFFLGSEEDMVHLKESLVKSYVIRFFMYYLISIVLLLLLVSANSFLMNAGVIDKFSIKRLFLSGLVINVFLIGVGTCLFFQ